ncbi:MAG: hypothetical protein ACI86M_001641 [Saprospiraceae bacterium]
MNNLVIFVNISTKLNEKFNTLYYPGPSDVSSDILTLFGIQFPASRDMNRNKVFSKTDMLNLMSQLVKKKGWEVDYSDYIPLYCCKSLVGNS